MSDLLEAIAAARVAHMSHAPLWPATKLDDVEAIAERGAVWRSLRLKLKAIRKRQQQEARETLSRMDRDEERAGGGYDE